MRPDCAKFRTSKATLCVVKLSWRPQTLTLECNPFRYLNNIVKVKMAHAQLFAKACCDKFLVFDPTWPLLKNKNHDSSYFYHISKFHLKLAYLYSTKALFK
jgi:hypothetical protein